MAHGGARIPISSLPTSVVSTSPTEQFLVLLPGNIVRSWAGLLTSRDWKPYGISRIAILTLLTHLKQLGDSGPFLVIGVT